MRRSSSHPYCFLETTVPVRHKKYVKFKEVEVNEPFRFDNWNIAPNLPSLIRAFEHDIKSHGWKSDPRKGTVNGIPMKRIPSDKYQPENFTSKELGAPAGFKYWQVNPDLKTVSLSRIWRHDLERLKKSRLKWKMLTRDSRWLEMVNVPMPEGWVDDGDHSGWIEDRNVSEKITPAQAQAKLSGLLGGTVDWEIENAFGWPEQDGLVKLAFKRKASRKSKNAKFWEVGGCKLEHPEKALYRALHYFGTGRIDELYKGSLYRIFHPDGIAFASLEFWKCEFSMRFAADKTHCKQLKSASPIRLGQPGGNAGEVEMDSECRAWFDLLVKLLQTKTMIYSGNNFEV